MSRFRDTRPVSVNGGQLEEILNLPLNSNMPTFKSGIQTTNLPNTVTVPLRVCAESIVFSQDTSLNPLNAAT